MKFTFTQEAWEDFEYWLSTDKAMTNRLRQLIKQIVRAPFEGIGKPEPLRHQLQGCWSRRINQEHRLVYIPRDEEIIFISCRFHYP
jgi:toxin YoeB